MIPAGTLKYKLTFFQNVDVQSDSGFVTKTKTELFTCKAAKVKITGNYNVNAKELFNEKVFQFKVRNNKLINENLIVNLDNYDYRILLIDENKFDFSLTLTIEKINN